MQINYDLLAFVLNLQIIQIIVFGLIYLNLFLDTEFKTWPIF